MMRWRLRRAGADDAEALSLVGAATFLESYAGGLAGADILAFCRDAHSAGAYRALAAAPRTALWLAEAEEGGAPVGYQVVAAPSADMSPDPDDLELKRIYLLSRLHGQRGGRRMLDEAVAHARAEGARRLLVGLWEGNARAMAFYVRAGFAPAGERPFTVGAVTYTDPVLALRL